MRFRDRALKRTVFLEVQSKMATLGWAANPGPFGSSPWTYMDYQPELAGETPEPNTCAVSLGTPTPRDTAELGGMLWSYQVPVFIDVYGSSILLSESFAADVVDLLSTFVDDRPILDFTDINNPVESVTDSFVVTEVQGPIINDAAASAATSDAKRFWRLVRFMAEVYYSPLPES